MSKFNLKIYDLGGGGFPRKAYSRKSLGNAVYTNSNCTSNEQQHHRFYYPNTQCNA
jgi:hypothetical protein